MLSRQLWSCNGIQPHYKLFCIWVLKSPGKLIHYVLSFKIWNVCLESGLQMSLWKAARITVQGFQNSGRQCTIPMHGMVCISQCRGRHDQAMTHRNNKPAHSHMLWRKWCEGTAPAGTRQFLSSKKWFFVRCLCGTSLAFLLPFIDSPSDGSFWTTNGALTYENLPSQWLY